MFAFDKFSKYVKLRPSEVCIDSVVFKLHYSITFWFLLVCTLLVSSKQFIKDHIDCISNNSVQEVVNTFCFYSATYTIERLHNASYISGIHNVSPGVGPALPGDEEKRHAYYQWVPFVLGAQAILFHIPHLIWKNLEKGRLQAIVTHARPSLFTGESDAVIEGCRIDSHETRQKKETFLKDIYLSFSRLKINRDWAAYHMMCEWLTLLNLLFQIAMVNLFLQGQFLDLGTRWMEDGDVLTYVFPIMTKCTFHKYGSSGTIENHDVLCVLSLNVLNEKLYVMMWFWFAFLLVVTASWLLWLTLCFVLHPHRFFNRLIWARVNPGSLTTAELDTISSKLSFADWLFLIYVGKNMDSRTFRKTVKDLCKTYNFEKESSLTDTAPLYC